MYYFRYKSTNILILILVNKGINKKFRSFERSELQAHIFLCIILYVDTSENNLFSSKVSYMFNM